VSKSSALTKVSDMSKRRWILLAVIVVIVCGVAAGTRYYFSKCHGMDACAAADAESHEREKPSEPQ
jgi:flagellar basal body-associated protein FliL